MYGTQTSANITDLQEEFENDVKMYGTQTFDFGKCYRACLRMM